MKKRKNDHKIGFMDMFQRQNDRKHSSCSRGLLDTLSTEPRQPSDLEWNKADSLKYIV